MKMVKYKSKYKKSGDFVYNKKYYILSAIFGTNKFKNLLNKVVKQIEDSGYTLPGKRVGKSPQFFNTSSIIDELLAKNIDIVEISSDILSDFGITDINTNEDKYFDYLDGVMNIIIYNQTPSLEPYGYPNYKYDNEDNPTELWIQIHPWTTKNVYDNYFPFITILKEKLNNSVHKIKQWKTYERDVELYKLFLKIEAMVSKGHKIKTVTVGANVTESKSVISLMINHNKYETIKELFEKQPFDDDSLAKLVFNTRRKLDHVQLV